MKDEKNLVLGFADFETTHAGDINALTGLVPTVTGNTVHLYDGEKDTGIIPEVYVKCGGLIVVQPDRSSKEYMIHSVKEMLTMFFEQHVDRCYYHNMRFDESYISSEIMRHGGTIDLDNGWDAVIRERLMGRQGVLYSTTIWFIGPRDPVSHRRVHRSCVLMDSAKIWATPLRKLGESFGIKKGNEALSIGCDAKMEEYCMQDCRILMTAMLWYFDKVNEIAHIDYGFMTSASTAYHLGMYSIQQSLGTDRVNRMFPDCTPENGFPDWIREGYKGATPLFDRSMKGKLIETVDVYDFNSHYPTQMITKPLPIGKPMPISAEGFNPDRKDILWIAKMKLSATVKHGHRGTFMNKHLKNGETLASVIDNYTGEDWEVLTSVDWEMLKRDYDIHAMQTLEVIGFHYQVGVFKDFLGYWYNIKCTSPKNSAMKAFAKLIINSFYGKFGTNPEKEECYYELNEQGCIRVKTKPDTKIDKHPLYLPFAMFVTAYGRNVISQVCNALGWEHVVYTDTDSVHVYNLSEADSIKAFASVGVKVDDNELGALKHESSSPYGIYIRAKGYVHFDKDKKAIDIKMAGANSFNSLTTVDDVYNKKIMCMQRRAYNVIGGKLIMELPTEVDAEMLVHRVKLKGKSYEESERIIAEREANMMED